MKSDVKFTPKCSCDSPHCDGTMQLNGLRFVCNGQCSLTEHSSQWPIYEEAPTLLAENDQLKSQRDELLEALEDALRVYEHLSSLTDGECKTDGEEPLCCSLCKETGCLRFKINTTRAAIQKARGAK